MRFFMYLSCFLVVCDKEVVVFMGESEFKTDSEHVENLRRRDN